MTDEQGKRLDWAVGMLKEGTPPLPEGFLERFEEKLALEPNSPVVLMSSGVGRASTPGRRTWTRHLMAAVIFLVALAGLLWLRPSSGVPSGTGMMVVAAGQDTRWQSAQGKPTPLQTVVEVAQNDTLQTGADAPVVLMAGSPGNEIKVAPQSKIRFGKSTLVQSGKTFHSELQLSAGAVFITETSAKVSVRTKYAVFSPVGTDYRVTSAPNSTTLEVLDGVVNAHPSQGGTPIQVRAGEKLVVGKGTRWGALRAKRMSSQELEPLARERKSFGRLQKRPSSGMDLPSSYPKAKPRQPSPPDLGSVPSPDQTTTRPVRAGSRPLPAAVAQRRAASAQINQRRRRPLANPTSPGDQARRPVANPSSQQPRTVRTTPSNSPQPNPNRTRRPLQQRPRVRPHQPSSTSTPDIGARRNRTRPTTAAQQHSPIENSRRDLKNQTGAGPAARVRARQRAGTAQDDVLQARPSDRQPTDTQR